MNIDNVRSEQEIRESLAEMERMANDADRMLNDERVKNIPSLYENFSRWKDRSSARASILKWVLHLPYLEDLPPLSPTPTPTVEAENEGRDVKQPIIKLYKMYAIKKGVHDEFSEHFICLGAWQTRAVFIKDGHRAYELVCVIPFSDKVKIGDTRKMYEGVIIELCEVIKIVSEPILSTPPPLDMNVFPPHLRPKEDVYRWVKASERLPEISPEIIWRFNDKSYTGMGYFDKGFKFDYNYHINDDEHYSIEWLEKIPPTPPDSQDKDARNRS